MFFFYNYFENHECRIGEIEVYYPFHKLPMDNIKAVYNIKLNLYQYFLYKLFL